MKKSLEFVIVFCILSIAVSAHQQYTVILDDIVLHNWSINKTLTSGFIFIEFRSTDAETKAMVIEAINSFPSEYYKGIHKIMIYGRERWHEDAWYSNNGVLLFDKSSLDDFENVLRIELSYNVLTQRSLLYFPECMRDERS